MRTPTAARSLNGTPILTDREHGLWFYNADSDRYSLGGTTDVETGLYTFDYLNSHPAWGPLTRPATELADAITAHLDEMGEHDANEQHVDGLRAELDGLLDTGADLAAFADGLSLDTGELPLNPPTHIGLLTADHDRALATARSLSFGVVSDARTGQVA